jgi:hypothetical protein
MPEENPCRAIFANGVPYSYRIFSYNPSDITFPNTSSLSEKKNEKDELLDLKGRRVRVYFNLHKGQYSVQDYKTKKVIAYLNEFSIKNAEFKVSKKGRARVIQRKQKNVHAFIVGELGDPINIPGKTITYNPYVNDTFTKDNEPIFKSDFVSCEIVNNKPKVVSR